MTLDERIGLYLAKCPPAVAGSRGHDQTFTVACALAHGFALNDEDALRHLTIYNATCSPPWKPRELRHKVQQAAKVSHAKPRGHLLGGRENQGAEGSRKAINSVPVDLEPQKNRFRTVRTVFFNPYAYARKENVSSPLIDGGALGASEPSGEKVSAVHIPLDDWTALNAEYPPDENEQNWQAVIAAGFGDEPLIARAFAEFGLGCRVIESGRAE